jgi:hypothetical protein
MKPLIANLRGSSQAVARLNSHTGLHAEVLSIRKSKRPLILRGELQVQPKET